MSINCLLFNKDESFNQAEIDDLAANEAHVLFAEFNAKWQEDDDWLDDPIVKVAFIGEAHV